MSLTIEQRVDKGIELLETYLPNGAWALKLDPEKLDMVNHHSCVLGQLARHIDPDHWGHSGGWSGYYLAIGWIEDEQEVIPIHDDGDWTADYGFQSAISEWRGDESEFDEIYPDLTDGQATHTNEYGMLRDEWIERIEQIKEASDG